jgi:catechol 2,3-dioxygenase-like lactoylglutathione lyase family enzyme
MKFNNIRLLVNDFDKAFAFYNNTLGLECTYGKPGDNYASFNIGVASGLAIFKAELMGMAIENYDAKKNGKSHDKFAIIVEVENVSDTYLQLKNKGVTFLSAPQDMQAWGIRVAHFRDTEGNLFEIYSALSEA